MKTLRVMFCIFMLSILYIRCEEEYSDRYLYIAVAGDYDVPFTGSYGDQYDQYHVHARTPEYYYYHLRPLDNHFVGEFFKTLAAPTDLRELTVRLYLKEFPEPASLLVEISQTHPESTIVVIYHD